MNIEDVHGARVLLLDADGPVIATPADTSDLIGNAWFDHVDVVALPLGRLSPAFFDLRSGLAGEIAQKAVNYHVTLAVLGDVSRFEAASDAVRAFVVESNRGEHVWFHPDVEALNRRLESRVQPS